MGDLLRAIESTGLKGQVGADATEALSHFLADAEERRSRLARQLTAADEFIGLLGERISR